ncbi:MAG: hypothetical protein IV092_10555 [Burkholderiaceae bacterium]|nr:hypothetical protein [Burkholderiaceae bacterium]MBT9501675.1 hypothetical protein [Burkholderiaceae bacterium]
MQTIACGVALLMASATLWPAPSALAQTAATSATASSAPASRSVRPDPLDPGAKVPALSYRSVFEGYRPNVEVEVGAWKEANDTVHRIGGWRAYAKEASQADAPPAPAATPASGPAAKPAGHAHH